MIKIKYPSEDYFIEDFKTEVLNSKSINDTQIEEFLEYFGISKTFQELLVLPFEQLIKLPKITDDEIRNKYYVNDREQLKRKKEEIAKLFNYKKLQKSKLSPFFMKHSQTINLKSCYYCNLDFVNVFIGFENEYKDKFDLINNHKSTKDLELIIGISEESSKEISKFKGQINCENDFNILLKTRVKNILNRLFDFSGSFKIENLKTHNHFTLDHILPQKDYPYLSLSLYNLVPSCYSCNSKFKKEYDLCVDLNDLKVLSPTCNSNPLKINDFFEFQILYNNYLDKTHLPLTIHDYNIKLFSKFNDYINILKLQGRYNFHKNISFEMIEKRKKYSDSQIDEIEKIFFGNGILVDKDTFKKQIFGSVIFETDNTNEPFEKYKKDIARQLGLIK